MLPVRIGFVGAMGNGKTTAAQYLISKYGFQHYSFAAKLKEICRDMWPEQFLNGNKPRELLQYVGSDMFRKRDPNVWVNYLDRQLQVENPRRAVIDDCRFINEAEALKKNGFMLVRVVRGDGKREAIGLNSETGQHVSETEQEGINADLTIIAKDIPELYAKLDKLMEMGLNGTE